MGGKTAMEFALAYEERVETLIVADIAPRSYPPQHRKILNALLALDLSSFQRRKQIETAMEPTIPELAVRQFLLKNVQRDSAGAFRWLMDLKAIHENYDGLNEALPEGRCFNKPALFLRGELSDYIQDQDLALIHRLFPRAEVRTIARAGHWLHMENPEAFLRNVHEFLNQQIGLARGKIGT
jgi:pimeloyl-ACP methyl ester carboxylesterase